jgi:hypothetical protein
VILGDNSQISFVVLSMDKGVLSKLVYSISAGRVALVNFRKKG